MQIKEYRVEKEPNYGAPVLKVAHTYETRYNGEANYYQLADMLDEIFNLSYLNEEYLYVISMDTNFHIKGIYEAGHGNYSSVQVCSRELFTFLLLSGAEKFVTVHNHPNGNLESSEGDKKWTSTMRLCANILHIEYAEHIIVTEDGVNLISKDFEPWILSDINWDEIKL